MNPPPPLYPPPAVLFFSPARRRDGLLGRIARAAFFSPRPRAEHRGAGGHASSRRHRRGRRATRCAAAVVRQGSA
eukprot:1897662-Pleurochrysis_carterae.AAC.2